MPLPSPKQTLPSLDETFFNLLPMAAFVCLPDGRISQFNPRAAELWGRRPPLLDEACRYCGAQRLLKSDGTPFADRELPVARLLESGEARLQAKAIVERPDGRRTPVLLDVALLRGNDGQAAGALACVTDLAAWEGTQAEHRELLERAQEAKLEAETLNQVGRLLTGELDLGTIVQSVTDAATRVTGAQFGAFFYNVIGVNGESYMLYALSGVPREKFSQFPLPRNTPLFGPTFRGERIIRIDDVRKDPRYGTMPPHHGMPPGHLPVRSYLAAPVVSRSGEVLGGLFFGHGEAGRFSASHERVLEPLAAQAAIAIDHTRLYDRLQKELAERRAAEGEVRRLNESLERRVSERTAELRATLNELEAFSYTVAHDLRAPLRAMHGFSQILLEDYGQTLGATGRELAERISAAGERMDTLIKDLLAYSRLTREEIRIGDLDLDSIVRDILLDMAKELTETRASVSIEGRLPRAQGHAVMLSQALTNLFGNAIKFVAPGTAPRVKIRAEPRGDMIRVWIEDNGIGIAPEHSTKLFRLFERLHGRERYPGTGIGLAIVRRALERMGGTSGFISRLGEGSRFWIELPKTGSQRAMPAAKKSPP